MCAAAPRTSTASGRSCPFSPGGDAMSAPPGAVAATRRLVLFDIDGTLLSTGPVARTTFASALQDVYGTTGDVDGYAFEGRLDPLIVADLMRAAGVSDE